MPPNVPAKLPLGPPQIGDILIAVRLNSLLYSGPNLLI
jgi:hypothetical protein